MNKNILKFYFFAVLLGVCFSSFADTDIEQNPPKCEKILIGPSSPLSHRLLLRLLQTKNIPWTSIPILMEKVPALKELSLETAQRIYAEFYRNTYGEEFNFEKQPRILKNPLHRLLLRLIEAGTTWSQIKTMVEFEVYGFKDLSIEEARELYAELYERAYRKKYDFETESRRNSYQRSSYEQESSFYENTSSGKTLYDILFISPNATQEEIKEAYKKLAQKWHPDRNMDPTALETMKQVNNAYDILSNPDSRRAYHHSHF